jgi:hypothetical protein
MRARAGLIAFLGWSLACGGGGDAGAPATPAAPAPAASQYGSPAFQPGPRRPAEWPPYLQTPQILPFRKRTLRDSTGRLAPDLSQRSVGV